MIEDLSPFVVTSLTCCRTSSSLRASTKSTLSRTQCRTGTHGCSAIPKGKRIQFFAEEAVERAGPSDTDTALFGCELISSSPKLRAHDPRVGKGQSQTPASPLQPHRIAHARSRPGSAHPGRDLQRARRRRSAGGSRFVDSSQFAGIWDCAVPRRPGEWRCAAVWSLGGCSRVWLHGPASVPLGRGVSHRARGVGRRPTAGPAAFVQRRRSPATLCAG